MPKMHEGGMHRRDMPFNCTKMLILSLFSYYAYASITINKQCMLTRIM